MTFIMQQHGCQTKQHAIFIDFKNNNRGTMTNNTNKKALAFGRGFSVTLSFNYSTTNFLVKDSPFTDSLAKYMPAGRVLVISTA